MQRPYGDFVLSAGLRALSPPGDSTNTPAADNALTARAVSASERAGRDPLDDAPRLQVARGWRAGFSSRHIMMKRRGLTEMVAVRN